MEFGMSRGECSTRKQVYNGPKYGGLDKKCEATGFNRGPETHWSSSEDRPAYSTESPRAHAKMDPSLKRQSRADKKILLRDKDRRIVAFSNQKGRAVSLPLRGPIQLPIKDHEGGKISGEDLVEVPLAVELGGEGKVSNQRRAG
jgi:hypothetical protein